MLEIKNFDDVSIVFRYIVPGIIIIWIRAQFLTGRIGPIQDNVLAYFTLSVTYITLLDAFTTSITGKSGSIANYSKFGPLIMLAGAVVFGSLVGILTATGLVRTLFAKVKLNLPHVIESTWDWRFRNCPPCALMITYTDGTQIYGWWGSRSFIGSDPQQRDLSYAGTWVTR